MASDGGLSDRGRGVLHLMVLAAAAVARLPRGNSGRGALAMARGSPIGAGIRSCSTLHLGLWADGTGHARAGRSAEEPGGGGFLPLRAESDVCRFCRRMDRTVDR